MNCRQVARRVSAYVDGELTGVEMLEMRRHMMDCISCREEFEGIRNTKAMLARLRTAQPSPEFCARLSAKLDEIQVPSYQRFWNSVSQALRGKVTPVTTAFVAASVALVVLTAGTIDETGPSRPESMAQIPSVQQFHTLDASRSEVLPVSTGSPFDSAPASFGTDSSARFMTVSFSGQ